MRRPRPVLEKKLTDPTNTKMSAALVKACDSGNGAGCNSLGNAMITGAGGFKSDAAKGLAQFEKACGLGSPPRDATKAAAAYESGCKLGDAESRSGQDLPSRGMLACMRRLALLALLACGRSNSAPVPAASTGNPPITSSTYHVRSDADLGVPLFTALAAAEKTKAGTFNVEIAAGAYKHLELESEDLAIVVEATGAVTFSESVTVRASAVTLRGVTIANARPAATALSVAASEKAELANIVLVTTQSASSAAEGDPLIDLVARKMGAVAKVDRLWVVDCQAATLLRIPANGSGRWSEVTLSSVVFVANRAQRGLAIAGLDPAGKGLAINNAFVAEVQLGEAWLQLATARPVTVAHATLALKGELSEGDSKPTMTEIENVKPPAKLDAKPFIDAARGGAMDRAALRALLL